MANVVSLIGRRPIDHVASPPLKERLLKMKAHWGVVEKTQADTRFDLVRHFRLQVPAAHRAVEGVIEVGVGGVPHGTVRRNEQDGRPVVRHIHGEFSSRNEPCAKHGVDIPRGRRRKRHGPEVSAVAQGDVCVETNVAPAVNAFVVAQAVNAEKVAFDEFPSRVNARKVWPR